MNQEKMRKSQRQQIAVTYAAAEALERAKAESEKKGVPMTKGALASNAILEKFGK
ncbi:hypothetical protein SAMN05720469_11579 [Fibrobacter intestinalis]|uniref:Uncharacterized protein n=1 Tax=Fibrobacter intestinalis TaxID=28122 RepID=A0A1M6UVE3_9BACT|nr:MULTISPECIES: hypothetical protein [Fibrobacter]PBC73069.1 hypothetical protein BGW94_0658 [Fibrobacter sp. NR9]SHK73168.1 hypothetical protein SAMN05720469_11579 [Fibrobacter intestinalis]SKA21333.1 hypothetical protein SAMN02745108_02904 [Fibrobacter intestinalis]